MTQQYELTNATDKQLDELEHTVAYLDVLLWADEAPMAQLKSQAQSWAEMWHGHKALVQPMKALVKGLFNITGDMRKRETWSDIVQAMMHYSWVVTR